MGEDGGDDWGGGGGGWLGLLEALEKRAFSIGILAFPLVAFHLRSSSLLRAPSIRASCGRSRSSFLRSRLEQTDLPLAPHTRLFQALLSAQASPSCAPSVHRLPTRLRSLRACTLRCNAAHSHEFASRTSELKKQTEREGEREREKNPISCQTRAYHVPLCAERTRFLLNASLPEGLLLVRASPNAPLAWGEERALPRPFAASPVAPPRAPPPLPPTRCSPALHRRAPFPLPAAAVGFSSLRRCDSRAGGAVPSARAPRPPAQEASRRCDRHSR